MRQQDPVSGPFVERISYVRIKSVALKENLLSSMALSRRLIETRQHGKGCVGGAALTDHQPLCRLPLHGWQDMWVSVEGHTDLVHKSSGRAVTSARRWSGTFQPVLHRNMPSPSLRDLDDIRPHLDLGFALGRYRMAPDGPVIPGRISMGDWTVLILLSCAVVLTGGYLLLVDRL